MPDHVTLTLMKTRRSPKLRALVEPGPTPEQLFELLTIAARVPDHGKLVPWRFIVIEGDARGKLGEIAARAFAARNPAADGAKVEDARTRFSSIPVTVAVVSSVRGDPADPTRPHPVIPAFEQELSAGAVCMSFIIAAKAMGFGAVWLTEWHAYDEMIRGELGVAMEEQIAGFLYVGTIAELREDRPRPDLGRIVTRYGGTGP
jgi:nitroreductase